MHDQCIRSGKLQFFLVETVEAEIFTHRGYEGASHALTLEAQHHYDIGVFQAFFHGVVNFNTHVGDAGRQQGRRGDNANACAKRIEKQNVGARHARVKHIAANGNDQVSDVAFGAADGQRVEQRLCRVLVSTVASIDDCTADFLRKERRSTGRRMAYDQNVWLHGVQRHRSVNERFALLDRRVADRHVHHVRAQPVSGELER